MGPSAVRLARLAATLGELGHQVVDDGNVEVPVAEAVAPPSAEGVAVPSADAVAATDGPRAVPARFLGEIASACGAAYRRLRQLPDDTFAVSLGGDHSISMGTVPALVGPGDGAVIWLDAHADLNTPESSPSGNVHGMPVAHLLGLGDQRLRAIWGGGAAISPDRLVYIGLRSVDEAERERIRQLGITAFSMKEIDQLGMAQVAKETLGRLAGARRLHLSFDADALDPAIAPGVGTPVPGGLSYREAHLLLELLADSGRVTSLDLVEVNPILDSRNRTAEIVVELTASLLGKRIL